MIHKSIFILGRQPALGRAELESLFGSKKLELLGDHAVVCEIPVEEIPFDRLGGSVRLAKPLATLNTTEWREIARRVADQLPSVLDAMPPEGKIKLGLSAFGLRVSAKQLGATGLELKKICKNAGRSVRVAPNTEPELSSAQVIHNHLTGEVGMELLLIRYGSKTYLAQTKTVQDIEAYARRDQNRPKRDARVGMLPPKLAQIIVNLATGTTPPSAEKLVLDPFCGTGVVLQEALLMGYSVEGTDIDQRMVDYSRENVWDWLNARLHPEIHVSVGFAVGDATTHRWEKSEFIQKDGDVVAVSRKPLHIDFVASETYLGRPLNHWPPAETLQEIIDTCNVIIKKFLRNVYEQIQPGTRLCVAVPLWRGPNGQNHHLPFLDHLREMGYNRISFEHAEAKELVYFRPNQIVARELLVITRN